MPLQIQAFIFFTDFIGNQDAILNARQDIFINFPIMMGYKFIKLFF